MPQIIPMKDLQNTDAISERCHATHEPLFVTKDGYGDLVVMSMETYDAWKNGNRIDQEIACSEHELEQGGELLDARDALQKLRRKHFG